MSVRVPMPTLKNGGRVVPYPFGVSPVQAPQGEALEGVAALRARAERAGQLDVVAGMFFHSTLEELARKLGPAVADSAWRLALGASKADKKDYEDFYRYPVVDLLRLMEVGARLAGGDMGAMLADFGRAATRAFFNSPMGRTLLVLGGREPHRLLFTLASGHNAPASFRPRACERTGARSATIRYTCELLGPGFIVGSIEQSFQTVFGLSPDISVTAGATPGDFELSIRW